MVRVGEIARNTTLEQMHRRCGYGQGYTLEDTWALSVDLVIVSMAFWGLSGPWMWWQLHPTRWWGSLALGGGITLYLTFLKLLERQLR
jgi:hypothetical protein